MKRLSVTIEYLKELAKYKKGILLSKVYKNNTTPLEWKCEINEHPSFTRTFVDIKLNRWCSLCTGIKNKTKITIETLRAEAESLNGKLISTIYYTSHDFYEWECNLGHRFTSRAESVIAGRWCPECRTSLSESICRVVMEEMFNEKFPRVRPKWLINPETCHKLELDGFSEKLQLAFEHQGMQHYVESKSNSTFKYNLLEIQKRDKLKKELCKKNGIKLLCIPDLKQLTKLECLKDYILTFATNNNIEVPNKEILIDKFKLNNKASNLKLEELIKLGKEKDLTLISKNYLGYDSELEWICDLDQTKFKSSPKNIKASKISCPNCIKKSTFVYNLDYLQFLAKDTRHPNGKCLANEYVGLYQKYPWKCEIPEHPVWYAKASRVKEGDWCKKCSDKKRSSPFSRRSLAKAKRLAKNVLIKKSTDVII